MKMELSTRIMSDIIAHMKYARFMPEKNRRETYLETVGRTEDMMLRKFPEHEGLIREAYDLVREKKILPSMRALEDSTPIITKSGWKPVGELQVGDIVYSSSGGETKVTEVIKHENKDLYKITFSDYAEIVACDDHLWIVSTNDDLRSNKTRVVDTKFVRAHLTQSGKNNITIWNPAPLQFSKKEYIIDPYILGHWLGDGFSNGHQTTLPVEDAEFFVAEYKKFGYGMTQSKSSNFWVWSVCGLYPQLKELNLVRNKHIPEEYLYGSVEQRLDLLQGLIDTNGHIAPEGRCFFYNTNTKIIGGVKQILSSLGIKYTVILHKKREKHHLDTYTVSFFTNLPVARLPRKKKNIRDFASKRAGSRKVFSVEHVGRGNATCINVTSPDRSFLAGEQMIVTHNCLQFAGRAIEVNNLRLYNCSYLPIDSPRAFSEFAFLLLCGTGVGMSVQKHHIKQLPPLVGAKAPEGRQHKKRFLISDDIEGWADAIKVLMESYFFGERQIAFDYRAIREKGALLKTSGGRAPGPAPLEACLVKIEHILAEAVHSRGSGTQLLPIEVYDICCHIGDMVLSGGQRRCLPEGTPVFTKQGIKPIEQVSVGDIVYTSKGEHPVTNVFDQGEQFVWNIETEVGSFEATGNHKMAVLGMGGEYVWKRVDELAENDRLLHFNSVVKGQKTRLPENTFTTRPDGSTTCKVIDIPELDTEMAWFIGYFHGNGTVVDRNRISADASSYISVSMNANNDKIVSRVSKQMARFGIAPRVYKRPNENTITATVRSQMLVEYFYIHIKQAKTTIDIPEFILNGSVDIRGAYLAGVMDSDGSICSRGIKLCSSVYPGFIEQLRTLYASLGIPTRHHTVDRTKQGWQDLLTITLPSFRDSYNTFVGQYSSKGNLSHKRRANGFTIPKEVARGLVRNKDYKGIWSPQSDLNYETSRELKGIQDTIFEIPIKVRSVSKDVRKAKTYDIEVDEAHEFFANGILTHNSAALTLFSIDDDAMMESKFGNWYETNPQRGRSNNSVMLLRDRITREKFDEVWSKVQASGAGEPGIVFSSDRDLGVNPCCEISLQSNELCNLTEINVSDLESQEDFEYRARMASRIATLQASFTDFHYVREQWRENVEEEALIGVSMTGIASGKVLELDMEAAAKVVVEENAKMAKLLSINPSARSTCVKPSGTASLVLGTSSGIHAWYAPYYWRRVSVGKEEPIYTYLKNNHPELLEDDFLKPTTMAKIKIPMKAPEGAMLRYESALDTLERVKKVQAEWITPGHTSGANKNNVSCTISVRENEWEEVGDWMWENRDNFTGISVLPYDGGSYVQTPFEECTKEEYEEALKYLTDIDLTAVYESEDNTSLQGEAACSGGACEVL